MKVFSLRFGSADRYWCLHYPEDAGPEITINLGMRSLRDDWVPLKFDVNRARKRKASDFPSLGNDVIVMTERSYRLYASLLRGHPGLEVLTGKSDIGDLYIVNVFEDVDCLDRARSTYSVDEYGDYSFTKYVFKADALAGRALFKFLEGGPFVFVTDRFLSIASENNLVGLKPGPVLWEH